MRLTYIDKEREKQAFAEEAAAHFAKNPKHSTYTHEDVVPGCLFALRWGMGGDCVVVFRISEEEVVNYQNLVGR